MKQSVVRWLQSLKLVIKSEFTSPWGICDLVGLQFNKGHVAHRLKLGQTQSISSMTRAALLLRIPDIETNNSITIKQLAQECSTALPRETVAKETTRLIEDGFVVCQNGERLQKINGWMPLQERFIAVELKLKRVEEALTQAENNFGFADESFVALPEDLALRIAAKSKRREDFERIGVGLISVTTKFASVLIPSSRPSCDKTSAVQLYSVEKFWQAAVKGS